MTPGNVIGRVTRTHLRLSGVTGYNGTNRLQPVVYADDTAGRLQTVTSDSDTATCTYHTCSNP